MKNLTPYFLILSIIFTSCSSNENEVLEKTQEKLLQSYTLKRDANGAYSIDFNTTNNTDVTAVKNTDNSNEIILSEVNHKTSTKHSNNFSIESDYLKIGFLEANNGKKTKISIEDENPTFAKGVTEFLNSYSITKNNNGTYGLSFRVNDNVDTDFIYNEQTETYEIHLSAGNSKQKDFTRELNINSKNVIKLDFVNHKYSGKTAEETASRKPRISWETIS